jgi:hypothetical protein
MAMGSNGGAAQTARDYVRPARVQLARLRPSAIRAWISSRSNSAIAAKILMVKTTARRRGVHGRVVPNSAASAALSPTQKRSYRSPPTRCGQSGQR